MPDYTERVNRLRVLWNRGKQMYASFYHELNEARQEIGDANFADWCFTELKISLSVLNEHTRILRATDAGIVRDQLAHARRIERQAKAAANAEALAERNRQRAEREAEEARKREEEEKVASAQKRQRQQGKHDPDRNEKWRRNLIAKRGVPALKDALANGTLPISTCERIAHMPHTMQPQAIEEAIANPNVRAYRGRRRPAKQLTLPISGADGLVALAVLIDNDLKRRKVGQQEWVEGSIDLCVHLATARVLISGDIEFGEWCEANGFGKDRLSHQDRAAAIFMGRNPEALRACLAATDRRSLRHIHNEEFGRFTHMGNPTDSKVI